MFPVAPFPFLSNHELVLLCSAHDPIQRERHKPRQHGALIPQELRRAPAHPGRAVRYPRIRLPQ